MEVIPKDNPDLVQINQIVHQDGESQDLCQVMSHHIQCLDLVDIH